MLQLFFGNNELTISYQAITTSQGILHREHWSLRDWKDASAMTMTMTVYTTLITISTPIFIRVPIFLNAKCYKGQRIECRHTYVILAVHSQ